MIRVIKNNFELKLLEEEFENTPYTGDWGGVSGNRELDELELLMSGEE